jgi:hypothetical protein
MRQTGSRVGSLPAPARGRLSPWEGHPLPVASLGTGPSDRLGGGPEPGVYPQVRDGAELVANVTPASRETTQGLCYFPD